MPVTLASFCHTSPARQRQQGVSMVEVLVTMLVTSIGLLGVASLQTVGVRMARDSGLMSQASFMATNMADKLRGNIAADEDAWNEEIEQVLPNGRGEVVPSADTEDVFEITVTWTESADSTKTETASERSYTLPVRL